MLRKLGKMITNNLGLKVLSAVSAVVLWVIVVNIDDPTITTRFTTSVVPMNTSYIAEQNKYYEWLDGINTVSFTVSAKRSILERLTVSDFSATADMERIEYDDASESYRVPVSIVATRYAGSSAVSITSKQQYLEVVLDDLGTCQKTIMANTRGSVIDGCALGEVSIVGSNLLRVSGPKSIVSQIATVDATIDVEGVSSDVTDNVVPVLHDALGREIDTTKLRLSLDMVTISAQILNTKDVDLDFSTTGKVADGYVVTDIEASLDAVRIKGEAATLNPVTKITIPSEVLDVTGLTESLTTTVDITSYLPSGTALVLNSDAQVEVTVHVEQVQYGNYTVSVDNLAVENLRSGDSLSFASPSFSVMIAGASSALEGISESELSGSIDVGNLSAGEHEVPVDMSLESDQCWLSNTPKVSVTIEEGVRHSASPQGSEHAAQSSEQPEASERVSDSEKEDGRVPAEDSEEGNPRPGPGSDSEAAPDSEKEDSGDGDPEGEKPGASTPGTEDGGEEPADPDTESPHPSTERARREGT